MSLSEAEMLEPGFPDPDLPKIVVTGASGFIGRNLLRLIKDRYNIFAIARRPQATCGAPVHPNIRWIRTDIGNAHAVENLMNEIALEAPIDFFFHLAGYYDFGNKPNPEYERTNVNGTRYILDHVHKLELKRFIFTSSLTVKKFTHEATIISENSQADADFPYAITKKKCESMLQDESGYLNVTVIRLAAIFSDWCEYGPLYMFLKSWLSKRPDAHVLAGTGASSIPYLHVRDLLNLFLTIADKTDQLSNYMIFNASPNGSTSHKELFEIATRYYFGKSSKPIYVPKWLAWTGVFMMDALGRFIGKRPFVRTWMIEYVDHKMEIDANFTQQLLEWEPFPRLGILRRLLFLIENMKSNPIEWEARNQAAIKKSHFTRPCLVVYESMIRHKETNILKKVQYLLKPENKARFHHYQDIGEQKLWIWMESFYRMLANAVHSGDRMHILGYAHNMARERYLYHFTANEVMSSVRLTGDIIVDSLYRDPACVGLEQRIYDEITMTIQLVEDEVEEVFYRLENYNPCPACVAAGVEVCSHDTD